MLKGWDTNLLSSEKRTLFSFLVLYTLFTVTLLSILGAIYYNFQKDLMLQKNRIKLSQLASEQIAKLKHLHVNFDRKRVYPRDKRFQSAIYDSSRVEIFSTFNSRDIDLNEVIYTQDDMIYFIKEPESYYLGTKYLVLETPISSSWAVPVFNKLAIYGVVIFSVMTIFGYFLLRLLLKPMREAIELLDRFIKDTTHELNTPVNAIMSNIEMIDTASLDEKLAKKIKRIDIGARTVSNLYQDLTYLVLAHKLVSYDEDISLKELIEERIEYFYLFCESKKLTVSFTCKDKPSLHADRKKITKLIDNLFSNAIKYNRVKGKIEIELAKNYFEILDSGRGIKESKIQEMFQRYARADESVGGFGIGLSIVYMIACEYSLHVEIKSQYKEWTKVRVSWQS